MAHFKEGDLVRSLSKGFVNVFTDEENRFTVEGLSSDNNGRMLWLCKPLSILGRQLCHFYADELELINVNEG